MGIEPDRITAEDIRFAKRFSVDYASPYINPQIFLGYASFNSVAINKALLTEYTFDPDRYFN